MNETKMCYNQHFGPMSEEYLANFTNKFVRPVPKGAKRLTKYDRLLAEFEEFKAQKEDEDKAIQEEHEKQISSLQQQIAYYENRFQKATIVLFIIVILCVL